MVFHVKIFFNSFHKILINAPPQLISIFLKRLYDMKQSASVIAVQQLIVIHSKFSNMIKPLLPMNEDPIANSNVGNVYADTNNRIDDFGMKPGNSHIRTNRAAIRKKLM